MQVCWSKFIPSLIEISLICLMIRRILFAALCFSVSALRAQERPEHPCAAWKAGLAQAKSNNLSPAQIARTEKYDVGFCKLDLEMTNLSKNISGTVRMQARTRVFLDSILFELHPNLNISRLRLNGDSSGFIRRGTAVLLAANLPAGTEFSVETSYSGTPPDAGSNPFGDAGMSNASSQTWGNQITWTLSQPFSAYEWWPCKQSLRDKLDSVEVHITVPSSCKAGSNGLLKNVVADLPGGKSRYEWKHRHPIDYYLVSVAVGKYVDYSLYAHPEGQDSILIQNYIYDNPQTLNNFKDDIDETADFLELFSGLFGPYPYRNEKYGHSMAPFGGGMEHQTMTTQGTFNATLTAHELAHQWFGDHVTCASWADIWVNEGFATYSEYLMLENLYPAQAAAEMTGNHNASMQQTTGAIWVLDSLNSNRIFSSRLSYSKGAAFIHTLRYLVNNDSLFFTALRLYQSRFADSTALGTDLKATLEEVSGINLDEAFEQWYYGEGYPSYALRWNTGNGDLYLRLSHNVSAPAVTPLFTTPVSIRFSRTGLADTTIRIPVSSNNELVLISGMGPVSGTPVLDPSNFIINKTTLVQKDPTLVITGNASARKQENIRILPGAAEGSFMLESSLPGTSSFDLLDTRGRSLQSGSFTRTGEIDLSRQPRGQYLLRLVSENGQRITHRILHR